MEDVPMRIFTIISDDTCVVEEGVLRGQYFLVQEMYNHAYFNKEGNKDAEQIRIE